MIRRSSAINSVDQPLKLPNVSIAELETLLDFIDERCGFLSIYHEFAPNKHLSMKDGFSMDISRWINLLSIAHKLELRVIKPRAVREVFAGASPPDPIRQLVLHETYDVPRKALASAMNALIMRPETLSEGELAQLSNRIVAEVGRMREDYLRKQLELVGFRKNIEPFRHSRMAQMARGIMSHGTAVAKM
jgi:hypothetical protein